MFRLRITAILLFATIIISLPSCQRAPLSPLETVNALYDNELSPPPGITYHTEAAEGSKQYLSDDLLLYAYGIPKDFDGIISVAVRLSSYGHPCEFAIFYCKSRPVAEDVAIYCRGRIDSIIKNAAAASRFSNMPLDEYLSYLKNSAVIISGRYVAMLISSDLEAAKKILYKSL